MKKISLTIIAILSICCGNISYSGSMGPINEANKWTGFYLGANAGYWWSSSKAVNAVGTASYMNSLFPLGAGDIANALAVVGTNSFSINSDGFIGGGQVGYNYQLQNQFVLGLEADIDDLSQSNTSANTNQVVVLAHFPAEHYNSMVSVNKKLDYLGTVRGRLGYLWTPSLLLYGTGGFAYGDASLNETFTIQSSLGAPSYAPINLHNNIKKTGTGWTAGGGLEWMFRPNWSAKIEGIYYDIGTINNNVVLSQMSFLPIPPVIVAAASVNAATKFTAGAIRIGLNYHC
ncbi:MAG: outer membrane protein [Legionellales bacterium]